MIHLPERTPNIVRTHDHNRTITNAERSRTHDQTQARPAFKAPPQKAAPQIPQEGAASAAGPERCVLRSEAWTVLSSALCVLVAFSLRSEDLSFAVSVFACSFRSDPGIACCVLVRSAERCCFLICLGRGPASTCAVCPSAYCHAEAPGRHAEGVRDRKAVSADGSCGLGRGSSGLGRGYSGLGRGSCGLGHAPEDAASALEGAANCAAGQRLHGPWPQRGDIHSEKNCRTSPKKPISASTSCNGWRWGMRRTIRRHAPCLTLVV